MLKSQIQRMGMAASKVAEAWRQGGFLEEAEFSGSRSRAFRRWRVCVWVCVCVCVCVCVIPTASVHGRHEEGALSPGHSTSPGPRRRQRLPVQPQVTASWGYTSGSKRSDHSLYRCEN